MSYNPNKYQLKSLYLPHQLCNDAENRAKSEYMNFSAYIRKLIVEDLRVTNITKNEQQY